MRSNNYAVVLITALLAACSSTPATHMIVPSRSTIPKIERLTGRGDVVADILTVDRKEYLLHLDGSGGNALSGRSLTAESGSQETPAPDAIRVPFAQLALVYYGVVSDKPGADNWRPSKDIPKLPNTGPQDHTLDCGELEVEVARVGSIRWYARSRGGASFTAHQASVQHAKNGSLAALGIFTFIASGGRGEFPINCDSCSKSGLRFAVTAADRREIGLLEIKRDLSCPAHRLPDGETTDLDLLNQIESSREALAAHRISDDEQMDQQTQLLDHFGPPAPLQDAQVAHTSP